MMSFFWHQDPQKDLQLVRLTFRNANHMRFVLPLSSLFGWVWLTTCIFIEFSPGNVLTFGDLVMRMLLQRASFSKSWGASPHQTQFIGSCLECEPRLLHTWEWTILTLQVGLECLRSMRSTGDDSLLSWPELPVLTAECWDLSAWGSDGGQNEALEASQ